MPQNNSLKFNCRSEWHTHETQIADKLHRLWMIDSWQAVGEAQDNQVILGPGCWRTPSPPRDCLLGTPVQEELPAWAAHV